MIINKDNIPILKFIELLKTKQPYKTISYAEILAKKPISERPLSYKDHLIMTFNHDKECIYFIEHGIDGLKFIDLFKSLLSKPNFRNRYICNTTAQKFIIKNVEKIKQEWLYEMSDQFGVFHLDVNSYIYLVETIESKKYFRVFIYYPEVTLIGAEISGTMDERGLHNVKAVGIGENYNEVINPSLLISYVPLCILFLLEFSEVETKYIDAKIRKVKINGVKYLSKSNIGIEIVDSSYYTNIIRSAGFDVSGHFRWQKIGEGRQKSKLIWIKDFKKDKYERKARVKQNIHI